MCINVILFEIILDKYITHFKTLNVWYAETPCLIDFKLTGCVMQVNRSLCIDFQVIL